MINSEMKNDSSANDASVCSKNKYNELLVCKKKSVEGHEKNDINAIEEKANKSDEIDYEQEKTKQRVSHEGKVFNLRISFAWLYPHRRSKAK